MSYVNPEDKDLYEKDKKVTISFIDEIFQKKKLKNQNTEEEKQFIYKIVMRSNMTQQVRFKLETVITSSLSKFEESMKQFGFDHANIMHIYANVLVQEILDAYELLKRYLLIYVDKSTLDLKGNEPLGVLLKRLKENGINHKFDECMDVELRNALAHGSYWFMGEKFYYVTDPTLKETKNISISQLYDKMRDVEVLAQAFGENAVPRMMELMKLK